MNIKDIIAYKENAISILKKNTQYATAKATEEAFSALIALPQIMWERDVAIEQLESYGVCFAEKADVTKVKHGYWNEVRGFTSIEYMGYKETTVDGWKCSECEGEIDVSEGHFKYCPFCGAKMNGGVDNNAI